MVSKNVLSTRISSLDYAKVSVATISSTQHFRFGNYFRHYYCCCRHQLTQFCKAGPSYWKQMSFLARENSSQKSSLNSLSSWDFWSNILDMIRPILPGERSSLIAAHAVHAVPFPSTRYPHSCQYDRQLCIQPLTVLPIGNYIL